MKRTQQGGGRFPYSAPSAEKLGVSVENGFAESESSEVDSNFGFTWGEESDDNNDYGD